MIIYIYDYIYNMYDYVCMYTYIYIHTYRFMSTQKYRQAPLRQNACVFLRRGT